jgi:opacity protein-like surface antigen
LLWNVRWSGAIPFEAWQATIEADGYTYTFVVPKVCGNLSLVSRVPVPRAAAAPVNVTPPPPEPEPVPEPPAVVQAAPPPVVAIVAPVASPAARWLATGFFGTNFSTNVRNIEGDDASAGVAFGFQAAYLWAGRYGGEVLTDFGSSAKVNSVTELQPFFPEDGNVNAYMANALVALPFGNGGMFKPYVSGGLGAVQFRSHILDSAGFEDFQSNSRLGYDIGAGAYAFGNRWWGIRGDVRWFDTRGDSELNLDGNTLEISRSVLSGLNFWRANIGISARW